MVTLTDQLGREITLSNQPKRIVSLVPSQTELLYYLGLDSAICGITKFCIHPTQKTLNTVKIGGTKQLNIPLIKSLGPDLIIANKEENDRLQLEELMSGYPTYVSDPYNLTTALQMINDVGVLTGREGPARRLYDAIMTAFNELHLPTQSLRVAYFIWRKPYMVAGKLTFIDDMLQRCGFTNAFEQARYPQISVNDLVAANPEVVLLSSEPYPFKQKHVNELQALLPNALIKLVDGEMFSWYGSRMLYAPGYFMGLINSIKQL
ncbi:helical backbone metal receptor [Mucilaginibacter boryungensis]|uniref:ABC transporter substrate-binding protein n=1 Tax=Mucilaginibacter boryungensis TaxID=768480 RepID=A0ABR9XEQ9_9SPHI|nr:helical backbone metal receptor [Mucilaginibacter boryungensis]MBE9665858.1 ABC transporter substrate-binding protein [Mucilaginibacter boryungensis]